MQTCLIHANCQGEPLARLLLAQPGFAARHRCGVVLNYTREEVPAEALSTCGLFLYQHLGPEWGELSSAALLSRLPPGATSLCIPNLFFKGYWPLWTSAPDFDYSDVLLDALLERGLSRAQVLHLYLRTDPAKYCDLDALAAASLEHERRKEAHTPIKYVDLILCRYRKEHLFFTVNHPKKALLRHVADGVLAHLGLPPLSDAEAATVPEELGEIELPVHPAVASRFGLSFAAPDRLWEVYGRKMDFAEYAGHYVDCKLIGEKDFIGYLRVMALRAARSEENTRHTGGEDA
ncbi:hypothetical protein dsx2_1317 [Desulfovibrio sp. X2]|uniref:WcbI family polysaccharide biosynthesis putative acetyltransferase n=1 Tax=Desulfovibrio sp. X2 TaxID=941449 RepID=UPI000358C504|nr:WcbI family polysaccharide biosynthesis putative acetyltransferase [Desulfovibrio sp. X2]EPR44689.1 hypothetical protein dsx2_1317 [Desulfovibrio sp. X2]